MIIWINGAFGAGKTTLAEELSRRLPEMVLFDPEYVGYLARLQDLSGRRRPSSRTRC